MPRLLIISLFAAMLGCGSVSRVEGWAGGHVRAGVEGQEAIVVYQASRQGLRLQVDRSNIEHGTAVLWITVVGPDSGPREITPISLRWSASSGEAFDCVQVNMRLLASGTYKPAAAGCGPIQSMP